MDSPENPGEILQDEVATEVPEPEVTQDPAQEYQEEISNLIFPEDQDISVAVYAYVTRSAGKPEISAVMKGQTSELTEIGLEEYEIRSLWTVPTAAQMDEYRTECSEYQTESLAFMINNLKIRDVIIAHHLKELLLPPKYKPFPFKYARPNRLSGETVKKIKSMHSGIYDTLYNKFISESCLIV